MCWSLCSLTLRAPWALPLQLGRRCSSTRLCGSAGPTPGFICRWPHPALFQRPQPTCRYVQLLNASRATFKLLCSHDGTPCDTGDIPVASHPICQVPKRSNTAGRPSMAGDPVTVCTDTAHATSSFSKRYEFSRQHMASCIFELQLGAHRYHLYRPWSAAAAHAFHARRGGGHGHL